jgi:hypothetical protein
MKHQALLFWERTGFFYTDQRDKSAEKSDKS